VIAPNDLDSVFQEEDYDWVTLLTCENYQEELGTYAARRIVRAVLVEVR
jgi:sortase (surface protein transpeptidase)